MKTSIVALAAVAALCAGAAARAADVQHAFLVQNSGWMEPFYADPASQLKPLVGAVAQAASRPSEKVFTLAFSQSNGKNQSPLLLGENQGGAGAGAGVNARLAPLGLARKGEGAALADTDFQEAVTRTITGPFQSRPGIVWIFTNNKNSPNNDQQTAERNRDFYRLLHLEPSIRKTVVFPLKMPVRGKLYQARGLMVYALAYGQPAADALDRILAEGRLKQVLTRAPARLKPVDADAVRIVPRAVGNSGAVKTSLGADGRTVVLDVDAGALVPRITLDASLQNLFYPYVIEHAEVNAALSAAGRRTALEVSPATVAGLQPAASQAVQVRFDLPVEQIPSAWSPQALAAMGKQVLLPMRAEVSLGGQRLALADSFADELRELFPGDPISEVFTPPATVRGSTAQVPLLVRVQYPLLPVFVIIGAVLALLGGLLALGLVSRRSTRYPVKVDGVARQVLLKPFQQLALLDADGNPAGIVKRGLGRPAVLKVEDGHTIALG